MNTKLRRFYSRSFPLLFVLNSYSIGSNTIGLGNIVLIMLIFVAIARNGTILRKRVDLAPILLLALFIFLSLISFLSQTIYSYGTLFSNFIKMLIWALGISILAPQYLDINIFKKSLRTFCIFCTTYLYVQNILWNTLRVFIPNLYTIGPIHPVYEMYSQDTLREYIVSTNLVRFSSILNEPSIYGYLMIVNLVFILFSNSGRNSLEKWSIIETAFVSVGVIMSTATAAIIFLAIIWIIYFAIGNDFKSIAVLVLGAFLVIYILFYSPLRNNNTISWFIYKLTNMDSLGRVGQSYENLVKLSTRELIFGVGLGNTGVIVEGYLNSFTSIIISYGVIGFLSFILFALSLFKKGRLIPKILVGIYIISSFQGNVAFSLVGMMLISLSVVMINSENSKLEG